MAYLAYVIDTFADRIVGWRALRSAKTDFVLDALEQILHDPSIRDMTAQNTHRAVLLNLWLCTDKYSVNTYR